MTAAGQYENLQWIWACQVSHLLTLLRYILLCLMGIELFLPLRCATLTVLSLLETSVY
jgi:hypothetical protein